VDKVFMKIGILALQGDYEAHAKMLAKLDVAVGYVRHKEELLACDGLVIPGGESTTFLNLLEIIGLKKAILDFAGKGHPVFGTCAGAILLATNVKNPPQESLGLIDMTIERNAYGRQLASFVDVGENKLTNKKDESCEMVFIRAPKIISVEKSVRVLAEYDSNPVCVQQNNCLAATFHPELSDDLSWHRYFLSLVKG
jgi:5'-phosphate synthase pdxT subunit